ncbi:FMN-linked oxidoreductase [Phellopilus nigrolimitatus]|nr:FMN-linked oxidoreductase [Phellopilus nigrolimitatus]
MPYINKRVATADQFYPLNEPAIGSAYTDGVYPQNKKIPKLFEPITIRDITFKNRIFVSLMCQYSSDNGHATDWHLVHIGSLATRGVGAICMEATSVVPGGRISPEDAGLWADSQIAPLQRIVNFAHAHDTMIGIQLAHAGRKASTYAPWVHSDVAHSWSAPNYTVQKDEGGWEVIAVDGPSDIPFSDTYPTPRPLVEGSLKKIEDAFVAATERCKVLGLDFIELHFAHGYLMHEFLSPLSNNRTDQYGGESLENRMSWPLKVVALCRKVWADKPLFVRISASDWAEDLGPEKGADGKWKWWGIEQSKIFVKELKKLGIDLVDVSTGGQYVKQNIPLQPGYQVPFAEAIKQAVPEMPLGTVGLITSATHAESVLRDGKADVVFLARELSRNPSWALYAAEELGVAVKAANQYERSWTKMLTPA